MHTSVTPTIALVFMLSTVACVAPDTDNLGEAVGTFDLTGSVDQNSCGASAVPALDPSLFVAELYQSRDGKGVWRVLGMKGQAGAALANPTSIEGRAEDHHYVFELRSNIPVLQPNAETNQAGCDLVQEETLSFEVVFASEDGVDHKAGDLILEGTHHLEWSPSQASDCAPIVAPPDPFNTLPCGLDYDLYGLRRNNNLEH